VSGRTIHLVSTGPTADAALFYLSCAVPSPILTSTLTPSFDALLRKHTGSPARDNGFVRSSSSLSCLSSCTKGVSLKWFFLCLWRLLVQGGSSTPPPAQTSPRKSEEQKVALLTEMTELIGRLGEAHYWLLKTIADLLGWTVSSLSSLVPSLPSVVLLFIRMLTRPSRRSLSPSSLSE
jgi:hypothetical protein